LVTLVVPSRSVGSSKKQEILLTSCERCRGTFSEASRDVEGMSGLRRGSTDWLRPAAFVLRRAISSTGFYGFAEDGYPDRDSLVALQVAAGRG